MFELLTTRPRLGVFRKLPEKKKGRPEVGLGRIGIGIDSLGVVLDADELFGVGSFTKFRVWDDDTTS